MRAHTHAHCFRSLIWSIRTENGEKGGEKPESERKTKKWWKKKWTSKLERASEREQRNAHISLRMWMNEKLIKTKYDFRSVRGKQSNALLRHLPRNEHILSRWLLNYMSYGTKGSVGGHNFNSSSILIAIQLNLCAIETNKLQGWKRL